MPVIEVTENLIPADVGKLTPMADQKQFVSMWAVKGSRDLTGFPNARDMQSPQPFGHGSNRALSGWEPVQIPVPGSKGKQNMDHVVTINGVEVMELRHDRESVELRDKWCGEVSRRRIDSIRQEELDRLDRQGLPEGKDPDNMRERIVADTDELPEAPKT